MVEVLAALAIVGLALGGLTVAVTTASHGQARIGARLAQTQAVRTAEVELERALQAGGAFRARNPSSFSGEDKGFSFNCRDPEPCRVDLGAASSDIAITLKSSGKARTMSLRTAGPAHFEYQGLELTRSWPPSGEAKPVLRAILLVRDDAPDAPVLVAKVWREQPSDCVFDVVMQDCR